MEIKDREWFKEIASRAIECRVKKDKKTGMVKVKARTKRRLYTIKIPENELEDFLKELKCAKIVRLD